MSLPEAERIAASNTNRSRSTRGTLGRTLAATSCLLLGISLGGCQVRPLYADLSSGPGQTSTAVQDQLAAIELESIETTSGVDKDVRREFYNELTFLFERGAGSSDKRYRLKVLMDLNVAEVGVEELADVPAAYTLTINSTFVLQDKASEKTLMTGKSFATASYDFSNQRFANIRAKRDAGQRAARVVAGDIQARIAGYFATHDVKPEEPGVF